MAQLNEYPDELNWALEKKEEKPGSFLKAFLEAIIAADPENYELMRPVVLVLMQRYPLRGYEG